MKHARIAAAAEARSSAVAQSEVPPINVAALTQSIAGLPAPDATGADLVLEDLTDTAAVVRAVLAAADQWAGHASPRRTGARRRRGRGRGVV